MALLSTVLGFSVFGLASRFGQLAIQKRNLMESMFSSHPAIHISDTFSFQTWLGTRLPWLHLDMQATGHTTMKYEQTSSLHGSVRKYRPGRMLRQKQERQEQLDVGQEARVWVGCSCSDLTYVRNLYLGCSAQLTCWLRKRHSIAQHTYLETIDTSFGKVHTRASVFPCCHIINRVNGSTYATCPLHQASDGRVYCVRSLSRIHAAFYHLTRRDDRKRRPKLVAQVICTQLPASIPLLSRSDTYQASGVRK